MPFAARNLGPVETAADFHLNSLRPETQRFFHGFSHGASKGNSLFKLGRDLFRLQLCVQFRLVNLLDRNQNFAASARRNIAFQLIDLGSLSPDDNSRSRRIDDDFQTVGGAFDVHVRDAGAGEAPLQLSLQLKVLDQKIAILLLRKPVRMPVLVIAEAKTVRMNFLAQYLLQSGILNLESEIQDSSLLFSLLLFAQGARKF